MWRSALSEKNNTWSTIKSLLIAGIFSIIISACETKYTAVHIEVNTVFATIHTNTFRASGYVVNRSRMCRTGIVDETGGTGEIPPEGTPTFTLQVHKIFTCYDGTGSFEMDLDLVVDREKNITTGTWVITGGEGRFESLRGSGTITGQNGTTTEIFDTYDGYLE
jgi:hypothetical protein